MGDREVTYTVDRQGKPALLSQKESVAQQLINGVFLVPGNIPNLPIGVDIESYLYTSKIDTDDVSDKLRKTCGRNFMSSNVNNVACGITDYDGNPTFVLTTSVGVDKDKDTLGLVITGRNDTVHFNYKFMSEGIKKAYGEIGGKSNGT